jgi:hypothetical protein
MRVESLVLSVREHPVRVVAILVLSLLAVQYLRGCLPGLNASLLPPDVQNAIAESYVTCRRELPIWPGEVRQPTCGEAEVDSVGEGTLPSNAPSPGITRAACYKVKYRNPFWSEIGGQPHEMAWYARTVSKVAVLHNGTWETFPDQEDLDQQRWTLHACLAPYQSTSQQLGR